MRSTKKIIAHVLIVFISLVFTMALVVFGLNCYISEKKTIDEWGPGNWIMSVGNKFSFRYIYWPEPWCTTQPNRCRVPEEKMLPFPVEEYLPSGNVACHSPTRILFMGDSFTAAPWVPAGGSYESEFSKNYSRNKSSCVLLYRLAAFGVGTDQEFARFMDVVDILKPEIVVWQYFYNDYYDNIKQAIYNVEHDKLVRRPTWNNGLLLAGLINSYVPLFWPSPLGRRLLNMGARQDVFGNWPISTENIREVIEYNSEKIQIMLHDMSVQAKAKKFTFYTTTSPLECNFVKSTACSKEVKAIHDHLISLLENNSVYIPMDMIMPESGKNNVFDFVLPIQKEDLFNISDDKNTPGTRHLTKIGNQVFGEIFFRNYVSMSSM